MDHGHAAECLLLHGGDSLIGLDVKNGIILIEYIGQLHASGLPLSDASSVPGGRAFARFS